MKKILCLWGIISILTLTLTACSNSNEYKGDTAEDTADLEWGKVIEEENIEIEGRHYEYIMYCPEETGIRIISLKTKDDVLVIPAKLHGYIVSKVGGLEYEKKNNVDYKLKKSFSTWGIDSSQCLKQIIVSEGVKEIVDEGFSGARAEEIILPKSLISIHSTTFRSSTIGNVFLEGTDTILKAYAFSGSSIKEIHLPDDFEGMIGRQCFDGSTIERFVWPFYGDDVESRIGYQCFRDCKNLKEVVFLENQEHILIPKEMFFGCTSLKKLEFPASTGKVTFNSSPYADNYKAGVGSLVFKGKDTELIGCEYLGKGDHNFITVGKIIAPKESKAIKFAKKALKVGYLAESEQKEAEVYSGPLENYSVDYGNRIKLVPLEYEET